MSTVSKRELVIIGAGGFGSVAASMVASVNALQGSEVKEALWNVLGFIDGDRTKRGTRHAEYPVLGTIDEVADDLRNNGELWFFCAIGDNQIRARIARHAENLGWKPAILIHPSALVDNSAVVEPGACVGPMVTIACNARIGSHVVVDSHVSIGHDVVLKEFCEIFSGARINGNCRVGSYAVVGCNATLLPGTVVGDRAVVGVNSVASSSVQADTTVFGVPARTIRKSSNLFSAQEGGLLVKEARYAYRD